MNSLYERLYGPTLDKYPRGHIQSNGIDLDQPDNSDAEVAFAEQIIKILSDYPYKTETDTVLIDQLIRKIEGLIEQSKSDKPKPIITSTHAIGKAIEAEQLAYVIDVKLNSMSSDPLHEGIKVGACLRRTHRTLQRAVVGFALGILYGISQQRHTDDRNRTAIETAQKVAAQIDADQLLIGPFI